ncbi:MAG: hypothetical protein QG671_1525 [Actinomycetota bacterium]|nr:hypothetical protein [Actinomycetota bacterium]
MRSVSAFLVVAAAVTLTPGPAFALLLQVAAVHGRRIALANIVGNSAGVLIWGMLSAAGVSALVAASQIAYDVMRLAGAVFLLWLGIQAVRSRQEAPTSPASSAITPGTTGTSGPARRPAWRALWKGLVNSLANPKLALFFVALFPQFITPGTAVLPAAMTMAAVIVAFDVLWFGTVAVVVDRFRQVVRPRVLRGLERLSGAVLIAFGLRLATDTH